MSLLSAKYICSARAKFLTLERHTALRADSRARANTGNTIAARIPMIAITTNSSIRVNPRLRPIAASSWILCPVRPAQRRSRHGVMLGDSAKRRNPGRRNGGRGSLPETGPRQPLPAKWLEAPSSRSVSWLPHHPTPRAFPSAQSTETVASCGFRPRSQLRGSNGFTPSSQRTCPTRILQLSSTAKPNRRIYRCSRPVCSRLDVMCALHPALV